MASEGKQNQNKIKLPRAAMNRIAIVSSAWNSEITAELVSACERTLLQYGVKKRNLLKIEVPGSFELPGAASLIIKKKKPDAVICLGCILQGETRHFEFISQAVANGIMQLSIQSRVPVIFGVLTVNSVQQARERTGGVHGHKGEEAAQAALQMISLYRKWKS
jgi:6,7-dimethyl-8-ribityllumazine synthase